MSGATLQMLAYRLALAGTMAAGFTEAVKTIRSTSLRFATEPLVGVHRIAPAVSRVICGRRIWPLLALYLSASIAFVMAVPVLPGVTMTLIFLVCASTYLMLDATGYAVQAADGRLERHVFHHLHLTGLCAIAAVAAEVSAALFGIATLSSLTGSGGQLMVRAVWGAIGAHYFISGCSKIASRGLRWPDARLLPLYTALLENYELGDTGQNRRRTLMRFVAERPTVAKTLLGSALMIELTGLVYPITAASRVVIGVGLVSLHGVTSIAMNISFRESLVLILVFSFPFLGWAFR
jgi:hypothetical protein